MDMFRYNHEQLLKGVKTNFHRYLYKQIKWDNRLTGIFGSRGVGKTTLLLQRIKSVYGNSAKALYLPLDNIWFQQKDMLKNTMRNFCMAGGTHLFLDNVHFHDDWALEVAKCCNRFKDLHVVFATSSLAPKEKMARWLKFDVSCYNLYTMSFREYLAYESLLDLEPYSLDDALLDHADIVKEINDQINVAPIFRNYLEHGCYPFYWEDPDAFFFRLQDIVKHVVDTDLPSIHTAKYEDLKKIKQLMLLVAESAPDLTKLSVMTEATGLDRLQIRRYLDYMVDVGYLHFFHTDETATQSRLQKAYLGNTNLLAGFFRERSDRQYMGETFFVDQLLNYGGTVELLVNNDFLVNSKYTFMVGDPLKDYDRIRDVDNAFAAIYGQPKSVNNKMPVWVLGLCY